ncbi:sensor histidine kinase [Taibaiella soli]|uniref:histidine kinase n=1 Tax=Taibaiella soli TaxID=1649169 RepID=A0A2W2BE09_9BACT|nr:HAMP domain-containing sensor histidine kinase [Taibaiella soli]PZF71826.1 hypothetical protein DN068_17335 [Taibaiella soli]
MKIVSKFTMWYLCISLIAMLIGGVFAYYQVRNGINNAETERLKNYNDIIAEQIRTGNAPDKYMRGRPVEIKILGKDAPITTAEVHQYTYYNPDIKHRECWLSVKSFYKINDETYSISSYNYVTKANEILMGLLSSFICIVALSLLFVIISGSVISKLILAPFYHTVKTIQTFSIKSKQKIQLPKTGTKELNELNVFLKKMTDKAVDEYAALKEFSENASHELQTPLAIIRSKMELLVESDITEEQAALIADMQNAIEKLSKINRSLTLLTKLENEEYDATKDIKFCRSAKDSLSAFSDLMEVKGICLHRQIDSNVTVMLNPALADILLNNLLSNAIRHNLPENGQIDVLLTKDKFCIKNTGNPPNIPTEDLFRRFKKVNQSGESIGIGLAIVKQICDLNKFKIRYTFEEGWHIIEINFRPISSSSKLLQNDERTLHPEIQL